MKSTINYSSFDLIFTYFMFIFRSLKDVPVWRVKKWGFSFEDLLKDPLGRDQLGKFLAKEFSEENIR